MTIVIPTGRTLPLAAKGSGGFASAAIANEFPSGGGGGPITDLPLGTIINDNFDTADRSAGGSTIFDWRSENGSIVTQIDANTGRVVYNPSGNVVSIDVPGVNWNALHGAYSTRIRYAGAESYQDPEQNWRLIGEKAAGVPELWMRYALRVPTNYRHTSVSPSNLKICNFWMDGYSQHGSGATLVWEAWGDGNGGCVLAVHWNEGAAGGSTGHVQHTPFISYPADQGRWMYICARAKVSSAQGVSDGEFELWRRWSDESTWTKLHEKFDARMDPPDVSSGYVGWAHGYLMGAVRGMPDDTGAGDSVEWLIDNFTLSEESLL